jgi:predicted lactoylglutathione lyase
MASNELDLGSYFPCLDVKDIHNSMDYYLKLGFTIREDHREENWAVLQHNNMVLCLFQGHIDVNMINFRGGDVEAIVTLASERGVKFSNPAHIEHDGSWSAETVDPDGNVIYFNTSSEEQERYLKNGTLI